MLTRLSIRNYVLIRELEIDFTEGFSVITGETGAGKSILLGALALILGQRADTGVISDNSGKCVIEGTFRITGYRLEEFFDRNDIDYGESLILRREISEQGKSRAFINDTPVNLALLKELGDQLVNVHSQHAITTLNDSDFQLAVLDSYAGISEDVAAYRDRYNRWAGLKRELAGLEEQRSRAASENDYNQFLLDELNLARLSPAEFSGITEQINELTHAEEIRTSLFRSSQLLSGDEDNILSKLTEIRHQVGPVVKYKPGLAELAERLEQNYIDLKDIAGELDAFGEQVSVNPELLETLSQRYDLVCRLMKKHHVQTVEELVEVRESIAAGMSAGLDLDERILLISKQVGENLAMLEKQAAVLAEHRRKAAPSFEKEVTAILAGLAIPAARFRIEITTASISRDGTDKVRFLFSANAGIEVKDLSSTASGGELSRLMLAIKSMISRKNLLPTIIFDEIDNGVSGEVAGKVGTILKKMGTRMQVIAITHLPQIAAKGDPHYHVFKTRNGATTATGIRRLTDSERVGEIAKMLSDEVVSDAALTAANELLNK